MQYWTGSAWVTVPGGSVTGNNKVWKKITFAPLTTTKIRVLISATSDGFSRIVEVEAWSPSSANIKWLVTDHLGTPRMVIDQTGSLANVKRHDYLPFGEELFAPISGRSAAQGYASGDGMRQQFTLKERDVETGLDYFLARYHSPIQGRFTSVDPLMASGRAASPQSWNRYSYVLNNPLKLVDPTGLQDDDPQTFTINNPCQYGTANCNPVQLATVNVTIPQEQPIPLETTDLSIIESVTLNSAQVASDTVIGAGKYTYNTLYGAANLVNGPIDYGLSFFTDFQFGQAELYGASTPGEQSAMYGMMICGFLAGGAGATTVTNPIPSTLARVVPGSGPFTTLGRPGATDVFVTAADDTAGMSAAQLGPRLGIPSSRTFTVIEFPTPASGIASPVFRTNPNFVGRGRTIGDAREFVIPNGPIPANATIRIVE